jgi:hypothetical protein
MWLNLECICRLMTDQELLNWQERSIASLDELRNQPGWGTVGFKPNPSDLHFADLRDIEIACKFEFWKRKGKEVIFRLGEMVVVNKEDLVNGQRCTRDDLDRIERRVGANTRRACWERSSETTASPNDSHREGQEGKEIGSETTESGRNRRVLSNIKLEEIEEY